MTTTPGTVEPGMGDDTLRDAPSGTTDTSYQDRQGDDSKPRRWWQFWRWFEKDETGVDRDR